MKYQPVLLKMFINLSLIGVLATLKVSCNYQASHNFIDVRQLENSDEMVVVEGQGYFLGADDTEIAAKPGDILVSDISEPHGVRATSNMRIVVTIAPPF